MTMMMKINEYLSKLAFGHLFFLSKTHFIFFFIINLNKNYPKHFLYFKQEKTKSFIRIFFTFIHAEIKILLYQFNFLILAILSTFNSSPLFINFQQFIQNLLIYWKNYCINEILETVINLIIIFWHCNGLTARYFCNCLCSYDLVAWSVNAYYNCPFCRVPEFRKVNSKSWFTKTMPSMRKTRSSISRC